MKSYDTEQVVALLVKLKLDKHSQRFRDFGVNGELLVRMQVWKLSDCFMFRFFVIDCHTQAAHMTEIGMSAMEQLKLTVALEKLTGQSLAPPVAGIGLSLGAMHPPGYGYADPLLSPSGVASASSPISLASGSGSGSAWQPPVPVSSSLGYAAAPPPYAGYYSYEVRLPRFVSVVCVCIVLIRLCCCSRTARFPLQLCSPVSRRAVLTMMRRKRTKNTRTKLTAMHHHLLPIVGLNHHVLLNHRRLHARRPLLLHPLFHHHPHRLLKHKRVRSPPH